MKVLIGYFSAGKTSGIDHYLLNFLSKIDAKDYEIDFLTRLSSKNAQKLMSERNCNLLKIPRNNHPIKQFRQVRKYIKQNHYDIAYFNISEPLNCIGLLAAKSCGVKTIIAHSHGSNVTYGYKFIDISRHLINKICRPFLYYLADVFLACSNKAATWLYPKRIVNTKQYKIIPNAIDFDRFTFSGSDSQKVRQQIRQQYHIPDDALIIGYIGRFNHAKNNLFLVDILQKVLQKQDAYLFCIGEHVEEFDKFQAYAKKLGVLNHIITPGIIKNTQDFYQAFDVFVLPSRFEGLPVVAIEAQASGLPCLLSDKIDHDVKISQSTTFLSIKNPEPWAKRILSLTPNQPHVHDFLPSATEYNLKTNTSLAKILTPVAKKEPKSFNLAIYTFFLLHYLANLTNILNGIHVFLVPGALCILFLCINYLFNRNTLKDLLKDPLTRLLSLFYLSFILTNLLVTTYDLTGTIKTGIWTIFYFCFAFGYKMQFSKRTVEYEVGSLSKIFIALLSAINLANLVLLYLGISKHIVAPFNGEPTLVGLARWGRFYGFFYDPNYASIVCICAILLSIHFLCRAKKTFSKILYIFAIILQLAYILAGQSRTGYIALAVSLLLYIILYFSHAKPPRFTRQKLLSIFFSTLLISVSAFSLVKAPEFLNKVNTKASTDSSSTSSVRDTESTIESSDDKTTSENTKVSEKVKKLTITLARTDNSSDISNRRFDIWKSGLEILQHSNPLIGIGHSNYIGFAEANLPETYIVSNSFQKFDAFHNSLIDLIVSQGILGFLIVATIVVYLAYLVIKNSAVFAQSPITISLLSSLVAICVSSMFVSEIFYINNCCTFLFWVFLGYYYYFLQTANQQRRLKHVKH